AIRLPATVDVGVEDARPGAEVGTVAERAAGAGDHQRPDLDARVDAVERLDELALHRVGERVEPLRAIERDRGHTVGDVVADLVERHRPWTPSGAPRAA